MAKDPICNMDVDPKKAKKKGLVSKKDGKNYYFCSKHCAEEFDSKSKVDISIVASVILVAVAVIVMYFNQMILFMGIVLLGLSILKFLDLRGFAKAFSKYDIIAKRSESYGLIYPFIELGLALMFLFNFEIKLAGIITFIIMSIGAIGVYKNVFLSKDKIRCACVGVKVKVPLTKFTLVEDIIMALMGLMIFIG